MNRLKFLVFALVALGLWAYHLLQVSPVLAEQGQAAASAAVVGAPQALALRLEAQRSEVQAAALKFAASPAAWNAGPKSANGKAEAPTAERFEAVRTALKEQLSDANKAQVVIAVMNEAGALIAQGDGEAQPPPEGFEVGPLADAGASGSVAVFGGKPVLFFGVPMLISDKNEVRASGAALVGVPLLPELKALESLAKGLGVSALGVVSAGKVIAATGDKAAVEAALKGLKAGVTGVVDSGPARSLGPVELPVLVGTAARVVGARQAIAGTGLEVVALADAGAASLANYQVFALGGLAGLALLTIVFTLLLSGGGEESDRAHMVVPPPMPVPPISVKPREEPEVGRLAAPLSDHHAAPEASPDDFEFPPSPSSIVTGQAVAHSAGVTGQVSPSPPPEAMGDPFAAMAPAPSAPTYPPARFSPPPAAAPSQPPPSRTPMTPFDDEDDESARTVAYPAVFKGPTPSAPPPMGDPFALAGAQEPQSYDDNPDTTRVAAVPQELLKQTRGPSGVSGERPAFRPAAPAPAPRVAAVDQEERHFQDVYREFVSVRERCGESADGLSFDKFRAKLVKNKEQLVAKYQCRTVRFQVYVKEGKAALKATPVKD